MSMLNLLLLFFENLDIELKNQSFWFLKE